MSAHGKSTICTIVFELDGNAFDIDPGETIGLILDRAIEAISESTEEHGWFDDAFGQKLGVWSLKDTA